MFILAPEIFLLTKVVIGKQQNPHLATKLGVILENNFTI